MVAAVTCPAVCEHTVEAVTHKSCRVAMNAHVTATPEPLGRQSSLVAVAVTAGD